MPVTRSSLDQFLLRSLRKLIGPIPLCLFLRDESEPDPPVKAPVVRIADRRTLLSLLTNPEIAFGDGFGAGTVQIEGDLVAVLEAIYRNPVRTLPSRIRSRWMQWKQSNTRQGSRHNIHHHYDLSNDFYKLWLDRDMVYTCAYFPERTMGLEEAQTEKLDLVCRKLRLQPGERVVEAGCGWGALALYMARNYGVKVKAYNISHEQIAYARERAKREGLEKHVEFIEDDYRNISGNYDVFASVGMLEHVGKENYHRFSEVIQRAIGSTGRGFLHFIGRNRPVPLSAWIRKRIFPGAYPPPIRTALGILEEANFGVLDIENLRQHYALTLEHWLTRFDRSYQTVSQMFGEEFARMWRLYLAGSVVAFRVGTLQLFQVVFAGRDCAKIPWNREYLYDRGSAEDTWIPAMSS